jgi:hypothetical protein
MYPEFPISSKTRGKLTTRGILFSFAQANWHPRRVRIFGLTLYLQTKLLITISPGTDLGVYSFASQFHFLSLLELHGNHHSRFA